MGFNDQDQNQQNQGYNQQLAMNDQTNKNYRARLVSWSVEIDEYSMLVEHDTLMGQMDKVLIFKYATSMMGLWRAIRPQLLRENNMTLLQGQDKIDFDYFDMYDKDIGLFLEPSKAFDEANQKEFIDYKNMDDLNKLHNILLLALVKLDVLSSSVGY
jgi:hypothetical protein